MALRADFVPFGPAWIRPSGAYAMRPMTLIVLMHAYRYYIYNAAEISLQTYKLILGHECLHDA